MPRSYAGSFRLQDVWDRAWLMFEMRRLVIAQGDEFIILPAQRPLLEYYANSIRHLLPQEVVVCLSPVDEVDPTLPRLASREELDIMTRETAHGEEPEALVVPEDRPARGGGLAESCSGAGRAAGGGLRGERTGGTAAGR